MEYDKLYLMTKFFLLSKPRILDVDSFPPFRADFFLNHIKFTSSVGTGQRPFYFICVSGMFFKDIVTPYRTPSWRFTKKHCKGKQFTTENTINGRSLYW